MFLHGLLVFMGLFSQSRAFHISKQFRPMVNTLQMRTKKTSSLTNIPDSPKKTRSKNMIPFYKPRSENQRKYVSFLNDPTKSIVFGIGPAGCGKTLFACLSAINGLKKGSIQKIVLTRPIVPVEEEELGFLPGSLVNKMDPWTRPLMDIFLEYYTQQELQYMIAASIIEISPLAYMRGRTFKRCFIIADEMQNSTPNQMLMLTTRIGDHSKMVITGDLKQSDKCQQNGLLDIMNKLVAYKRNEKDDDLGIELIEMNKVDIERSPVVSKILKIYEEGEPRFPPHPPPITDISYISPEAPHNDTYVAEITPITESNESPPDGLFDLSKAPKNNIKIDNDAALIPAELMTRRIL